MNQLSHLPQHKQSELAEIVKVICEVADPAKVILFGSHATGKWVEDEYVDKGTTYTYISDYDILVVLSDKEKGEELEIASKIDNRTGKFKNEVSAIVHSISYINNGLERGQYFFSDIVKEGITLYDSGEYSFVESRPLTNEQLKELAIEDFNKWVKSGSRFLEATKLLYDDFSRRNLPLNEVIFNLNQSAERFYSGVLLVYTGYKPKTHRIKAYRKYAKHVSEDLYRVFRYPRTDSEENRLFKILNDAYIDARYKDDYFIAPNDLKKLISKVDKLEEIVIRLCEQRIVQL
ncbi:HEPN domain-containing protein [Sphingobacterium ginsenosidimutans]|uniref:HEPN domain-containing protein n=1 Tax=Sphingobacterium ginsenosidimutans TaxID=687845 RepID=A0ABP7ZW52_9SPHI